jgi:hypothetical protein
LERCGGFFGSRGAAAITSDDNGPVSYNTTTACILPISRCFKAKKKQEIVKLKIL